MQALDPRVCEKGRAHSFPGPGDFAVKTILLTLFCIVSAMIVSSWHHADEVRAERRYVMMVCSGSWPDFMGLKPDCKKVQQ